MRLAPLADMVKPAPKFQLRSTDDVLSLIKDNSKVMGRSVKIISAVSRKDLREIFAVSYKRNKLLVEQVLNETEVDVNPSECLEKAKQDNDQVYLICVGILNILARAMIFDNAMETHTLDVKEVGSWKFCSFAFLSEFPYSKLFSRKISQLLESGLVDHWNDEAVATTERESRRNVSTNATIVAKRTVPIRKDPISVQLISIVMNVLTSDYPSCSIILCAELLFAYWEKIRDFIKRMWKGLLNLGCLLFRKISNFLWESNQTEIVYL